MRGPARGWVFTDSTLNSDKFEDPSNWVRYTAYSEELCPTTGRKHFQGFLETHDLVCMNKAQGSSPIGGTLTHPSQALIEILGRSMEALSSHHRLHVPLLPNICVYMLIYDVHAHGHRI